MQSEATVKNIKLADIVSLTEKSADLKIANNDLKNQLTEVKFELKQLKTQDEQTRPIKVITKTIREGGWGGSHIDQDVQYMNLDSVRNEIQKEYEIKEEQNLIELKKLNFTVSGLQKDIDLKGDEFDSFQNTETKRFKIKADNLEASFKEKANKLDQKVTDLQEELQKERDNKTDKELEEKRNKEIITLKKRIKTLEEEVKLLASLGFIKRTWRKLTNHIALKSAKKELEIERKAVNEIPTNHGYCTRATNSLFKFIDLS